MDPSFKYFLEKSRVRCTERYVKKHFPELYEQVKQCSGSKWTEKLYNFYHPNEKHICPVCGRPTKFRCLTFGYNKYCNTKCSADDPLLKDKIKQTNLERYGVERVSQLDSVKEKVKQTNLKRYGGIGFASKELNEKARKTNLKRYGGIGFASKELNEKARKTNLKRYGVECYNNSKKTKQTNLERYGVENVSQSAVIKDRIKQTNLERYGANCPLENKLIKEKAKQTNLERYGVEYASQSDTIKEKTKQSIRQLQINTHTDLLGYMEDGSWICKCPDPKCNKCAEKCYITKNQIYADRKRLNIELCTKKLPIQPSYSTFELEIREYLDSLNVTHQDNIRGIIGPKELDIYIPDKKLAIECNGSYWHSIECDREPSDPNYHIDKYLKCKEKGIKLITIWDDWWAQNRSECEALIQYHLGLINEFHPTHLPTDTTDTNLHPTDNVVPVKVNHSGFDCWVGQFNIKS